MKPDESAARCGRTSRGGGSRRLRGSASVVGDGVPEIAPRGPLRDGMVVAQLELDLELDGGVSLLHRFGQILRGARKWIKARI